MSNVEVAPWDTKDPNEVAPWDTPASDFEGNIFPTRSTMETPQSGDILGSANAALHTVGDVLGAPNRAIAAATSDQKMNSPNAYPLKPLVDKIPESMYQGRGGIPKPVVEFAASAVTDPLLVAGAAGKMVVKGLARIPEMMADKIEMTALNPSESVRKQGFDIANLSKYDISGTPKRILEMTNSKIKNAGQELKSIIQQGKDRGATVNSRWQIGAVRNEINKNPSKYAAELPEMIKALDKLDETAQALGKNGKLNLLEAQEFKRSMGDAAEWDHTATRNGVPLAPDQSAFSKVAGMVNLRMGNEIERAAPKGVKEANKVMSDLIPISQAAQHKLYLDEKRSVAPFARALLAASAAPLSHGASLAPWIAYEASKSGQTARVLYSLAKMVTGAANAGQKSAAANKLLMLGVSKQAIDQLNGISEDTTELQQEENK